MIKTVSGTKRKVSAMAERAYNKSILTPQQREKAMQEELCYGCLRQRKFSACPKKSRVSAQMIVNPMQSVEEEHDDLEESLPHDSDRHGRILAVTVTKKLSHVPDAVLLREAQKGYQFADTELIVMKGIVAGHPVRVLFDTGSTHNVINSNLVKKLKLQTTPSEYCYSVELADGMGTETWDRRVVDLPVEIQSYKDRLDFELTRLARFDLVLSKQWHAKKRPLIDFSSHIYQFEHEGWRLLIRGEPDLQEAKILSMTKEQRSVVDHGPDKILDRREKRLRNRTLQEYLVAWKGLPLTDATWESDTLIRRHFPSLIIEDNDL
ncbi:hypothetical protein L7F22_031882 [Adiantum nelumboides]|nr:hypothetical protein [Adiantum nelumboides]